MKSPIRTFTAKAVGYSLFRCCVSMGLVWLLVGCATGGDYREYRYYYDTSNPECDIPAYWLKKTEGWITVLPWKEYRKTAYALKRSPGGRGFVNRTDIYLREGYSEEVKFHEQAHTWQNWKGYYDHEGPCWLTYKPVIARL